MYKIIKITLFLSGLATLSANAQEDAVRFFDLETKPVISVLYDQTYKRKINTIPIPTNIYSSSNQRRSINMAEHVLQKEAEKNYLARIYQSRIDQQQNRISQNYRTTLKTKSDTNTDAEVQFRQPYNYQPYGWQENYYNSSRLWRPTFYQATSYGRFRANRFDFY